MGEIHQICTLFAHHVAMNEGNTIQQSQALAHHFPEQQFLAKTRATLCVKTWRLHLRRRRGPSGTTELWTHN